MLAARVGLCHAPPVAPKKISTSCYVRHSAIETSSSRGLNLAAISRPQLLARQDTAGKFSTSTLKNSAVGSTSNSSENSSVPSFVLASDWERFHGTISSALSQLEARGPQENIVADFFEKQQIPPAADLYGFHSSFAAQYLQDDPERNLHTSLEDFINAEIQREILLKAYKLDEEEAQFDLDLRVELQYAEREEAAAPLTAEIVQKRRDQRLLRVWLSYFSTLTSNDQLLKWVIKVSNHFLIRETQKGYSCSTPI